MNQADEMDFWDHAEALRSVLLRVVALLVVGSCAMFAVMPSLFDSVILAPCRGDFSTYRLLSRIDAFLPYGTSVTDFSVELVNIRLASQFFIHISLSLWLTAVLAFPIILYLLWGFVAPGLYPSEQRPVSLALGAGCVMFFVGVAVGYFIVFPLTLRFLADYSLSTLIPNTISLDSYIDNFLMIILVMGIVFELPLAVWLAGRFGVLDRPMLARYRRHAVVALLILAAVITPSGDPFTLMVVFLPLYFLYELSALTLPSSKLQPKLS